MSLMIQKKITPADKQINLRKNGETVFACTFTDGELTCEVYYDFDPRPLTLRGTYALGEDLRLVLLPYRLELYVGETLCDEEWPKGSLLADAEAFRFAGFAVEDYLPTEEESPAVLGAFSDAEGWKPEENVFVGDCMPYRRGGEYHVLYLKDRHHHESKWWLGAHQWEHISTTDLKNWRIHPTAIAIDDPEEGSICTGSHIAHGGREYLFYTVRKGGGVAAPISRSVSEDGYHFRKDKDFGFVLSDRYLAHVARDPKVIRDDEGLFHMFLTTALREEGKGCLAHFISRDLDTWQDTGTPIYVGEDGEQPECPDYIRYRGRYYLIFSLKGKAHYRYSDHPFHGWKTPADDRIPCASVPKGALWEDKILFAGYAAPPKCYAGTMTFRFATANEAGELIFL